MKYLLCIHCWGAWYGAPSRYTLCGEDPVECSPWGADGWNWYHVRVAHKRNGVRETLATPPGFKRKVIARAARARGNTAFSVRATADGPRR